MLPPPESTPFLPALAELQRLIDEGQPYLEARLLGEVRSGAHRFPLHALLMGNPDPDVPAVGFFGGVHGLERIAPKW